MAQRLRKTILTTGTLRKPLLLLYRLLALSCVAGLFLTVALMPQPHHPPRKRHTATTRRVPPPPLRRVTVILDPGHGGIDSGYRRRDCREDTLNYRFTATVAQVLRSAGATVLFTIHSNALTVPLKEGKPEPPLVVPQDAILAYNRTPVTGSIDSLHRRAAFVRLPYLTLETKKKAAGRGLYFLAIHHDAYSLRSVRGGHVLYDRRDGGPPAFAHILARRLSAAKLARKPYGGQLPPSDARHLGVLNPLYNPVPQRALLEVATLTNPQDRDNALSRQWRWKFAHLVVDAIQECEKSSG